MHRKSCKQTEIRDQLKSYAGLFRFLDNLVDRLILIRQDCRKYFGGFVLLGYFNGICNNAKCNKHSNNKQPGYVMLFNDKKTDQNDCKKINIGTQRTPAKRFKRRHTVLMINITHPTSHKPANIKAHP